HESSYRPVELDYFNLIWLVEGYYGMDRSLPATQSALAQVGRHAGTESLACLRKSPECVQILPHSGLQPRQECRTQRRGLKLARLLNRNAENICLELQEPRILRHPAVHL